MLKNNTAYAKIAALQNNFFLNEIKKPTGITIGSHDTNSSIIRKATPDKLENKGKKHNPTI